MRPSLDLSGERSVYRWFNWPKRARPATLHRAHRLRVHRIARRRLLPSGCDVVIGATSQGVGSLARTLAMIETNHSECILEISCPPVCLWCLNHADHLVIIGHANRSYSCRRTTL